MCGIAGLYTPVLRGPVPEQQNALAAMLRALVHRGPDDSGIWSDAGGRCSLGSRRLSVIDLSPAGHQPMLSFDGRWVLAYNGEIYNFLDLKPLLAAAGVAFRGHSDSEVLADSIAAWGMDAIPRMDGMFAFAAFDTLTGDLLLARDPFGEKPLYYMELPGGGLAFASELTALESLDSFDGELSLGAIAELLMFEYIGAPRSIYERVRKLPPGHVLHARPGNPHRIERYFAFRPVAGGFDSRPLPDLADELEALLVRSLRGRVISDVPLGAFLSGGVDSSTTCALIRNVLGIPIRTFSIGFADAPESEHDAARRFAAHLGLEHESKVIEPGAVRILADIGRLLDEPNADWSCLPVYLLSSLAREHVTVALSGDGGDELFGGYSRYQETLESAIGTEASPGTRYYNWGLLAAGDQAIAELFGRVPSQLETHLTELRASVDASASLLGGMRETDVENYLPGAVLAKVDRMSMQHSLEVRTPFLNVEIARFAERMPADALFSGGRGKAVLREVAYRHLPRELVDRPKLGFGLPTSAWARDQIGEIARELLLSDESRLRGFFGARVLEALLSRPRAVHRWWGLCVFESWLRHHPATLPEIPHQERDTAAAG